MTMVQVRGPFNRQKNTFFSMGKHYTILLFIFSVICAGALFLHLHTREMKGIGSHTQQLRVKSGMAHAHSAKKMVNKPHLIYGTAWKKDDTARLVSEAVKMGFRFIDTACQPKHYNEKGVGQGWTAAAQELGLSRNDIWLQTKFTSFRGQDPNNIPYDPKAPLADQVKTSLQVSLKNLQTDYLDSWVLHSPMEAFEDTMTVWRTMEEAVEEGKVHQLGISNCYDIDTFRTLYQQARHKPAVLQNRFYAESNFDTELRRFCKDHSIFYQSFWTLTANRHALATEEAKEFAQSKGLTPQTALYAFLMSLGYVTPLDGTTTPKHMAQDVAVMERIEGGEVLFSKQEQKEFAKMLGMPAL